MTTPAVVRAYWRRRKAAVSAPSDRAYSVYIAVVATLFVVAPAISVLWAALVSEPTHGALTSSSGRELLAGAALLIWLAALASGRLRGPIVMPGFLAYVLGHSPFSRWRAFGTSAMRSILALACAAAIVSALVYTATAAAAGWAMTGMAVFCAAGAAVGVIAGVLWLLAEAHPGAAVPVGVTLLVAWLADLLWPPLAACLPWEWFGRAWHPASAIEPLLLCALALAAASAVPTLSARVPADRVIWQAQAWSAAVNHTATLDLSSIAELYRAVPSRFRRRNALAAHLSLPFVFLRRDAVGAARSPGRLVAGLLQIVVGVAVPTLWQDTCAAGMIGALLVLSGAGPFTDGLRHAADVVLANGSQIYGVSDARLIGLHSLLPALVLATVTLCGAVLTVLVDDPWQALGIALLAPLVLACLVARTLRGDLPIALLAPVESPVGDMASVARFVWALELPMLVALIGAAAAGLPHTSGGLVALCLVVGVVLITRWRRASAHSAAHSAER